MDFELQLRLLVEGLQVIERLLKFRLVPTTVGRRDRIGRRDPVTGLSGGNSRFKVTLDHRTLWPLCSRFKPNSRRRDGSLWRRYA